jgi:hypothetical protein
MIRNRAMQSRLDRASAKAAALPAADDPAATPHERLVRAAKGGRAEALVRKASLAQPVAMVTPEEREAELRASGQWPADKREPTPAPEPEPPAEPEREPTPNEQYIAEHCHWRRRGPEDSYSTHREGQYITEYDVLTGEIIGDGYVHHDDDDGW